MEEAKDFCFDGKLWIIGYLVVDTHGINTRNKVLRARESPRVPQCEDRILPVSLTREKVEQSPDADPVKASIVTSKRCRAIAMAAWATGSRRSGPVRCAPSAHYSSGVTPNVTPGLS
jgi:hypothetical protein